MASTSILRSQDCILRHDHFHYQVLSSLPSKTYGNPNANASQNSIHPRRRRRSPVGSLDLDQIRGQDRVVVAKFPTKKLVMGQVNIWGLGNEHLGLCSTDPLGSESEMVQEQINVSNLKVVDGLYAGSAAFLASPPPSSLPFSTFFTKKKYDPATSDLRRLLGLNLL